MLVFIYTELRLNHYAFLATRIPNNSVLASFKQVKYTIKACIMYIVYSFTIHAYHLHAYHQFTALINTRSRERYRERAMAFARQNAQLVRASATSILHALLLI